MTHGTYGAYQGGCHCEACTQANTEYHRKYRATEYGSQKSRAHNRARGRALNRLAQRHRAEFRYLLAEERRKEPPLNEPRRQGVTA